MSLPMNPLCSHIRTYACVACGKCDLCCECSIEEGSLQHVDSKLIAERWRVLRIMAIDREARR